MKKALHHARLSDFDRIPGCLLREALFFCLRIFLPILHPHKLPAKILGVKILQDIIAHLLTPIVENTGIDVRLLAGAKVPGAILAGYGDLCPQLSQSLPSFSLSSFCQT